MLKPHKYNQFEENVLLKYDIVLRVLVMNFDRRKSIGES